MDEKVIFFNSFGQCLKEDTCNLSLVEPEGPVIGSADQVVREDVLYDPSHALRYARPLPRCSDTMLLKMRDQSTFLLHPIGYNVNANNCRLYPCGGNLRVCNK